MLPPPRCFSATWVPGAAWKKRAMSTRVRANARWRAELIGNRDRSGDERAALGRALDPKPPLEGGDSVRQTHETGPVWAGAANPVVAHLHVERAVVDPRPHFG